MAPAALSQVPVWLAEPATAPLAYASDLNNYGLHLLAMKRLGPAGEALEEAQRIFDSKLGSTHSDSVAVTVNRETLAEHRRQFSCAAELYRKAIDLDTAHFGRDHFRVALDINSLGVLEHSRRHYREAEPLLRDHPIRHGADAPSALQWVRVARTVEADLVDRSTWIDASVLDRPIHDRAVDAKRFGDCATTGCHKSGGNSGNGWKLRISSGGWVSSALGGTGMILSQFQVPEASYNQSVRGTTSPVTIVSILPPCRYLASIKALSITRRSPPSIE